MLIGFGDLKMKGQAFRSRHAHVSGPPKWLQLPVASNRYSLSGGTGSGGTTTSVAGQAVSEVGADMIEFVGVDPAVFLAVNEADLEQHRRRYSIIEHIEVGALFRTAVDKPGIGQWRLTGRRRGQPD